MRPPVTSRSLLAPLDQEDAMTITTSKPFASVRSSRDYSLVAFSVALLTTAALSLGAFVPRLSSPEASSQSTASASTGPCVVASR
jgi:hypothetical protein